MIGRGGGDHVVELHYDVGADGILQGDGVLRCEEHRRSIVWTQEAYTFFGDFGKLEQRHHLEAGLEVSCRVVVDQERGITDPPLSEIVSSARGAETQEIGQAPVSMLCGHDCSLCAPPIASNAACPGFRPLHCVRSGYSSLRHCVMAVQMVCVVQT
jgi:hypothetical protein